jgi:uncharacterized repeat protein (TIGR01451 family)
MNSMTVLKTLLVTAIVWIIACTNPAAAQTIYVSPSSAGNADGVSFRDEDILVFDIDTATWSMYFDGSDVGLISADVNAFHVLDNGDILLSLQTPLDLEGASLGVIDKQDILMFTPTSLGEDTAGTFSWFFDGSDVGLEDGTENIDAIGFSPDGRLVISTDGFFNALSVSGQDEDLFIFNDISFGEDTLGSWEMFFDGSDVELRGNKEDVWGTWIDSSTGDIYMTTRGKFSVSGSLRGDGNDIIICVPLSLGTTTSCNFSLYRDVSDDGFDDMSIDGLSLDITGTIIITKVTTPTGGTGFGFTDDIAAPNSFTLDDGQSKTFMDVIPGTYTVTEDDPSVTPGGFELIGVQCDDGNSSGNTLTSKATINLEAGETVQCTFTNSNEVDLEVTKTESIDPVIAGSDTGNLTYVVTVTNNGPVDATGVELSEALTLPAGVSVDSITTSQGSFSDPTWTVGALTVGQSETLTVVLTVDGSAAPGTDQQYSFGDIC